MTPVDFQIVRMTIQQHHWFSSDLNQHIVLGELYSSLDEPLDKVVETLILSGVKNGEVDKLFSEPKSERYGVEESIQIITAFKEQIEKYRSLLDGSGVHFKSIVNLLDEVCLSFCSALYKLDLVARSKPN